MLDRWPDGGRWFNELWAMASRPDGRAGVSPSINAGHLLEHETPPLRSERLGKVFDRPIAPPAAFLRWLLANPTLMNVRDPVAFGAKNGEARRWRSKLFSRDPRLVAEAQEEGLNQLGKRLAQRGRHKWWAFEGFSRIDCCFSAERAVLLVEATPELAISPSTLWYEQRCRLWKHVEAARELAGGRDFGVMLAVETLDAGIAAIAAADAALVESTPHMSDEERAELQGHLLGSVTWRDIGRRFDLPSA
jgi:hypothetical protein